MPSTNDLKNGMTLDLDGQLWTVVEFQHVKPGKGGAFVRTTLKNVTTGKVVDRTFNAGVKVEVATVDKREMTYLYREGEDFVFMDTESYDQIQVPAETVGVGGRLHAREHQRHGGAQRRRGAVRRAARIGRAHDQLHRAGPAGRPCPAAAPSRRRSRRAPSVQVPLFVTNGERVKVDTRDGRYLGRAN